MRHHLILPRLVAGLCCSAFLATAVTSHAESSGGDQPSRRSVRPAFQPVKEDPSLPRVLLLGDSISIGYTIDVREQLDGAANVIRPAANCGPTTRGVEQIDQWLGDGRWDVIHFNFGLHDLKYVGAQGDRLVPVDAPGSRQQVPVEQYTENLQRLVERLQQTGAAVIWCTTTPVPEGAQGRVPGDAAKYNAAAEPILRRAGVRVNDLYAVAKEKLAEIQRPANVHFTDQGSEYLAEHVAAAIREALQK